MTWLDSIRITLFIAFVCIILNKAVGFCFLEWYDFGLVCVNVVLVVCLISITINYWLVSKNLTIVTIFRGKDTNLVITVQS